MSFTFEEVVAETKISVQALRKPCSEQRLLDLAEYCVPWNIVGQHLGLSQTQVNDIDRDYRTTEEKRIRALQRWKEAFAFKATYEAFVKALLASGRNEQAVEVCRLLAGS